MLKYLILALVVLWLWKARPWASPNASRPARRENRSTGPQAPQEMVACAHCGIHLPSSEALSEPTAFPRLYYCCQAHLQAGPAEKPAP